MALTRKMLKVMGIEDEKIEQIIEAHTETVDGIKAERDQLKENTTNASELQKKLDEATQKLAEQGKDSFKVKYEAIKEDFDKFKNGIEAEKTKNAKENAYKDLLKACNIDEKRFNAILKVTPLEAVELDGEGKIKNFEDTKKAVTTDWADFIVSTKQGGAKIENPPANQQQVDYDKMTDAEYYAATQKK